LTLFQVKAPAKLNLGLKVLDKRVDGYHNIHSIFQTINLFDELTFELVDEPGIEVVCATLPTGQDNLVFRAAEAMQKLNGHKKGIRITLTKGIPIGAGLGGGSSDAASAILTLNSLWELDLSVDQTLAVAESLGSDVPFFLSGGTAVVSGKGEQIQFFDWRDDLHYVLVYPDFKVSSGWAYQNLRIGLTETSIYSRFLNSVEESGKCCPDSLLACLENDFLPLLDDRFPLIGSVLSALHQSGAAVSSVSGSGSTVYGIFRDPSQAGQAASNLVDLGHPVYLCRPCQE
jgi:4-diphosphocytidyl-2-C-methyl-D-erythritol kinase